MKSQCLPKTGNCLSLNKQKTVNRSDEIQNFFDQENTKPVHIKIQLLLFQE